MRNIKRAAGLVFGLCLVASFGASADDTAGRTLADIREQQTDLLEQVKAKEGAFGDMEEAARAELEQRQVRLLAVIEGKDTVDDLDDASQVEAFNLLEAIKATIAQAESQQMVCEMTRKTGSHRKVKVCMTVAERDRLREDSRAVMEKAKNGLSPGKGFGAD